MSGQNAEDEGLTGTNTKSVKKGGYPKTGDTLPEIWIFLLLAGASVAVIAAMQKMKRNK